MAATIAPEVTVDSEGQIPLIINGRTITARVGPGLSSRPRLALADAVALFGPAAAQTDRRGDWPGALRAAENIGPVLVRGHRATVWLDFAFGAQAASVEWYPREAAQAGAQLGPMAMPATIVRFRLGPPRLDEHQFTLPLDDEDNAWGIASTSLELAGQQVRFAFAPHFARSVASAAAGGVLARAQGGRFIGQPQNVVISHGIARPARPVRLDRALPLGPVQLRDLLVRTLDYGTATGIADQSDEPGSPADILVTGRADRQRPHYIVYLGADTLAGCSSISFDKAARTIMLSCVQPAS